MAVFLKAVNGEGSNVDGVRPFRLPAMRTRKPRHEAGENNMQPSQHCLEKARHQRCVEKTICNTEIAPTTGALISFRWRVNSWNVIHRSKMLRCTRILRIKHIVAIYGWLKRLPVDRRTPLNGSAKLAATLNAAGFRDYQRAALRPAALD
ncbi:MAG TPA: hypothetical protein VGE54_08800 [Brevundimonas sp.]